MLKEVYKGFSPPSPPPGFHWNTEDPLEDGAVGGIRTPASPLCLQGRDRGSSTIFEGRSTTKLRRHNRSGQGILPPSVRPLVGSPLLRIKGGDQPTMRTRCHSTWKNLSSRCFEGLGIELIASSIPRVYTSFSYLLGCYPYIYILVGGYVERR